MQIEPQPNDQSSPANLPALLPPVALLLQRTQTTLGLLRDVVQESSAQYWYEQGEEAMEANDLDRAIYSYGRYCATIEKKTLQAFEGLILAYESRAEHKAREGDFEGSDLDKQMANTQIGYYDQYLDYLIAASEAYHGYE